MRLPRNKLCSSKCDTVALFFYLHEVRKNVVAARLFVVVRFLLLLGTKELKCHLHWIPSELRSKEEEPFGAGGAPKSHRRKWRKKLMKTSVEGEGNE